jgi:signal transduction histidine kinase
MEEVQVDAIKKGEESGIWQMDLKTGEYRKLLYDPSEQPVTAPISSILESENKSMWFAKFGPEKFGPGLYEFSKLDSSYTRHHYRPYDDSSLPGNNLLAVYEDRDGGLWVGTEMGLSVADVSRKQFQSFIPFPGDLKDPENNLTDIIHIREDIYWIHRPEQPLIEWNRETGEWNTLDLKIANTDSFWGFGYRGRWLVSNNMLWIIEPPTDLIAFDITTKEKLTYSNKSIEDSDYIFITLTSDSNNDLWLGTTKGVSKFSIDEKAFTDYHLRSDYNPDDSLTVSSLIAGKDGNFWAMTIDVALDSLKEKQGIYLSRFDPVNETFTPPVLNDNYYSALAHGFAMEIMEDSNGDIWISKSNGVVHYDRSEKYFTWYDQNDGLSGLIVRFVAEDEFGKIWLATSYGLSRFDPETKVFRNFERSDGVIPLSMNSLSNINGSIFLLGVGGMNIIDPSEIEEVSTPPKVLITGIKQNGKNLTTEIPVEYLEEIKIPWSESGLEIEYTAINFNAAHKTTYSYMLDGFNEEFQETSTRRYAQFTNLKPGDYTFRVNATNAGGFRSQNDSILVIRILPPWWRTWWAYVFYLMVFVAGVFAVDRYQRKRLLQKEREEAREKELEQAKEIEKAYHNLEVAHENLKSAQEQLVQQEKLASLGQLTAGIAHEIKNPLNFVNNFSEVSIDMIDEALEEVKRVNSKFNIQNSELADILTEIKGILKKIHEHGTRADGIVKSMLLHSRGGSGKMEPTPLNPLIKEYVNLAFHGMRAGKNSINVDIELQLDENVGDIPLIAEDFSRVILNLCNNAFDAMRSVYSMSDNSVSGGYKPKLTVRTHQAEGTVTIEIEDNGPGIPNDIKDKIMQPFFTTKKGTDGTGLGLSITNDIVKAHGGKMIVESEPGNTNFQIIFGDSNV